MASNPSSLNSSDHEKDCKEIHDSWGRLNQLGHGLAHRSRSQLQQVRETYKAMYGEDLVDCIQRAKGVNSKNEVRDLDVFTCARARAHTHKHKHIILVDITSSYVKLVV